MQKLNNEYALMVSMLVDLTPEEAIKERNMLISDEVDLNPKIKYINLKSRIEPAEFYFILDRSGSMQGDKIVTAKETLKLFLHSLPLRSKFNVISFGTKFESIFDKWVDYNQETMNIVSTQIKDFQADMGGTEIYAPLNSIFENRDDTNGLTKHLFLITDGAVHDPQKVIELAKINSQH